MTRSPILQQTAGFCSLFSVQETVFIPQKVADRLKDYLKGRSFKPEDRIFPLGYEAVRAIVKKAGNAVGVKLRPHDLRRHAATHASRSGVPVEIVSKVILRHTNLSPRIKCGINSSRNPDVLQRLENTGSRLRAFAGTGFIQPG